MTLSATTTNYAEKRNLELIVDDEHLSFYTADDDSGEPMVIYLVDGDFWTYQYNIWLPKSTKEELPATIRNEKHLREVIDFIGNYI